MLRALKLTALTVLMGGTLVGCISTPQNDILNATLWTQKSVEFKANSTAMYELAKIKLDEALANKSWTAAPNEQGTNYYQKPPAVMLDVDETVLDNSSYEAWLVANNKNFSSKTWVPFVRSETSTPVPGSLDFINYAKSKGVKIFYVSNRKAPQEEATRNNLKAFGYPVDTSEDTVLLRKEKEAWNSSKKSPRRAHITENYRMLMIVGDNFSDFVDDYKGNIDERKAVLDKYQDMWGSKWIMIANPMYGSWESAAFGHNWGLGSAQRRELKHDALDIWNPDAE